MATAQQLIDVAISQLGYKESPSGSNLTMYGKWYGRDGEPWCDMFVSWCANEVGMLSDIGKYAYCPYHVDYFKGQGRWVPVGDPRPGDICFFTSGGGVASHVGIVEWVDGEVIHTIEGNTSVTSNDNGGAVMRRERKETGSFRIMGYGRPNYIENAKRRERPMEFLIKPDGQPRMDYVCGDSIHPLHHPDEMTAIQTCYRKCYGEDIPCFAYGTPEAPWATRLYDALRRS